MSCSISGCGREDYCGGLCSKHYNRLRTRGTTDDGPRAKRPFEVRLWSYIKVGGIDECWPWIGKSNVRGYGYIGLGGRRAGKMLAHRAAWEQTNGLKLLNDLLVMHKCDNPACCNPIHLMVGTDLDNMRDMDAKGRRVNKQLKGQDHAIAKLTDVLVGRIRKSKKSNVWWAKKLNMTRQAIRYARVTGWRHL